MATGVLVGTGEPVGERSPVGRCAERLVANPANNKMGHPLADGVPPAWASGWGEDRFGPFVEFSVGEAIQKFRWVPKGQFTMGSPDDEPGRDTDEGPQHLVDISNGFWLFDTPCSQELYKAVMGNNPSKFDHDQRPVEKVSWEDCQAFMRSVAELVPGLQLTLPTEAEWEYACRAGTQTATYAGPIEIRGVNDAPVLHEIAWYGGNSGVEFDLDKGVGASDWQETQFSFPKCGTRKVATREANTWGLYDMLGNVWEWCRDGQREYRAELETDPIGPEASAGRVIRGGSWDFGARSVRAAYRFSLRPVDRDYNIGFRCRVQ